MKNALRFALVLGLISIVAALGISGVYVMTHERVEEKRQKAFQAALESIFPGADSFVSLSSGEDGEEAPGAWTGTGVGAAQNGAETLGYLAVGEKQGYSSRIRVLVGAGPDLSIRAIRILYAAETPGLGERAKEVKSDRTIWQAAAEVAGLSKAVEKGEAEPWFQAQFAGKTLDKLTVVKDPAAEGIQAITAATVTSSAVTDAVTVALESIKTAVGGRTAAAAAETPNGDD